MDKHSSLFTLSNYIQIKPLLCINTFVCKLLLLVAQVKSNCTKNVLLGYKCLPGRKTLAYLRWNIRDEQLCQCYKTALVKDTSYE
jgi:hypothetical protein